MGEIEVNIQEPNNSPFHLLESIAEVGAHPDKFDEVCANWAQTSEDVENLDGFSSLFNLVCIQSLSKIGLFNSNPRFDHPDIRHDIDPMSFIIGANLRVHSIGSRAAETLKIGDGDDASDLFNVDFESILEIASSNADKKVLGDIYGSDGTRHIASVVRATHQEHPEDLFLFTIWKVELPASSKSYVRETLLLTETEIEILELVLERRSVNSISEIRNCSVNTTRKHINNIKTKYKSRSLTDVISSTHEIIALHYQTQSTSSASQIRYDPFLGESRISNLQAGASQVEYSIYGDPRDTPMVVLHSIEYGVMPTKDFISRAKADGYCVYIPLRAGFGRTSDLRESGFEGSLLSDFFKKLNLENVTLISLSTSAPTSIDLLEMSDRVKRAVFVNYGFDTQDKIEHVQPVWVKGLLKFAIGSEGGFNFALNATTKMIRIIGFKSFYRKIYQHCLEDLEFLEANTNIFQANVNVILSAKAKAARQDFVRAFMESPAIGPQILDKVDIISVFGQHTHGISLTPIKEATEKMGVKFHIISNAGRNCIYQKPQDFFEILASHSS
ncbi:MAG: helix-turn-helix transcriptional regulator [Litorimonas sp.]